MNDSILGAKDLYNIVLRATSNTTINGKTYSEGEVVCRFDTISIANLDERKRYTSARGGNGNNELVLWDETQSLNISFDRGVFSKTQLAILINAKMAELVENSYKLSYYEELETNQYGQITLKEIPLQDQLFIYNKATGARLTSYTINNKTITLQNQFLEVCVDYYSMYDDNSTQYSIGLPVLNGFLKLEGRTRLKDDITGNIVTGIFTIPKLRLKTGLSIQLGNDSTPMINTFYGEAYPVGRKGHSAVSYLTVLSEDID